MTWRRRWRWRRCPLPPWLLATLLLAGAACGRPAAPAPGPPAGGISRATGPVVLDGVLEPRPGSWSRLLDRLTGRRAGETGFARPFGVAWDGGGLLVTDPGAARVLRLDATGRVLAVHHGVLESPIGVAVCPAGGALPDGGGVVVTDSARGELLLLDHRLRRRRTLAGGLRRPTGVACDDRRLVVAETAAHRLLRFDAATGADPAVLGRRGDGAGELNFPTAVALDGDTVWVGDTLNFRLQRLDAATGAPLGGFGRLGDAAGDMPRVKGVAVDRAGHLWVSDAYLDRVAVYRRDGTLLTHLGGPGREPGRFSFPSGVAAGGGGRVAVVDSLNRRVQLFRGRETP